MPENHKIKHCPRCDAAFECKPDSIQLCQCQTIRLSSEQSAYVNAQYNECLCVACLQILRGEYDDQQQ